MIEDKLEHNERLRLECLAQSCQSLMGRGASTTEVVERAKVFEKYVADEETDATT